MAITTDIQQQVFDILSKASTLSFVNSDQESSPVIGLTPGQQVTAEVLASLPDNLTQVQIGSQRFNLELPMAVRTGQTLEMTYITNEPRATFAIARQGRTTLPVSLSEVSRLLGQLADSRSAGSPAGILRTLLDGPPHDANQAGQMLQQGMRESGLFYESHLAGWFAGEYPLEGLLREPQGQLSRLKQQQPDTLQPHEGVADQRTLAIVHEQLTALQSGQVVFPCELFPGQKLEWSVAQRDAQQNRQDEQERSWDTALTLVLPKLGAICARLTLVGTRASIDIRSAEVVSAGVLNVGRQGLVEQIEAAGLSPGEIGVRHVAP